MLWESPPSHGESLHRGEERACYSFATVSPGKSGQTVAAEAGIHARQVAVSGQVARNLCPQGLGSGSGESWFDPRRGNSKRDATLSRVALRPFWTLFSGWSGEFCSRDRSNSRRHMMFRRLASWRPMRTTPAFKRAIPGIPRRSGVYGKPSRSSRVGGTFGWDAALSSPTSVGMKWLASPDSGSIALHPEAAVESALGGRPIHGSHRA